MESKVAATTLNGLYENEASSVLRSSLHKRKFYKQSYLLSLPPQTGQVKSSMLKVYSFLGKTFRELRLTFVTNF